MDLDVTYKDLIKRIVCNTECNKCIINWCESWPGTATLKEFLDQEFNKHEDDEKFNNRQWETTDSAILITFSATCEESKETLIDVIDDLTKHSYVANLKTTSSCHVQHESLYFSSDDNNHYTSFFIKFK